jgi:hypothetical protein
MEDIMEILHITKKGSMNNTLEWFHIHTVTRLDNQINDKCRVKYNAIFDTITHKDSHKGHSPPLTTCIRLDLAQSQTATLATST